MEGSFNNHRKPVPRRRKVTKNWFKMMDHHLKTPPHGHNQFLPTFPIMKIIILLTLLSCINTFNIPIPNKYIRLSKRITLQSTSLPLAVEGRHSNTIKTDSYGDFKPIPDCRNVKKPWLYYKWNHSGLKLNIFGKCGQGGAKRRGEGRKRSDCGKVRGAKRRAEGS